MSVTQQRAPLGSVLVTGGCGFLGSHILDLLLQRYSAPATRVHCLDVRTSASTIQGVEYHTADITDVASLRPVLERIRPDVIIHTVSPTFDVGGNKAQKKRAEAIMRKVNVQGTTLLLEEAKRSGCKAFVHTSSAGVISDMRNPLINADEKFSLVTGKLQPEFYTDTKAEAETIVLSHNLRPTATSSEMFLTCALRPSGIFGERDVTAMPNMMKAARDGRTGFQLGSNNNLFDWTYVGNVAHAHILAAAKLLELFEKYQASPPPPPVEGEKKETHELELDGEQIIITNQSPVYFWDFARALWRRYTALSPLNPPPLKPLKEVWTVPEGLAFTLGQIVALVYWLFSLGVPRLSPTVVMVSCIPRYYRTNKSRTVLGYQPIWTLDEALDRTVAWFCEEEKRELGKKGQ